MSPAEHSDEPGTARILAFRARAGKGEGAVASTWDGTERRSEPPELRLPSWVVAILITILFAMLSVVFSMGMTYMRVQSNTDRIDKLEQLLLHVNDRLNQIEQHVQNNTDEIEKHEQQFNRIERNKH